MNSFINDQNEGPKTIPELTKRIRAIKAKWGDRLFILGHYYQKPEILAVTDAIGEEITNIFFIFFSKRKNDCKVLAPTDIAFRQQ